MELKAALAVSLKQVRSAKGLTQEAFSNVSSRTYMSALERGLKAPTIEKLDELCAVMGVHMLSLLALSYLKTKPDLSTQELLNIIMLEVEKLQAAD